MIRTAVAAAALIGTVGYSAAESTSPAYVRQVQAVRSAKLKSAQIFGMPAVAQSTAPGVQSWPSTQGPLPDGFQLLQAGTGNGGLMRQAGIGNSAVMRQAGAYNVAVIEQLGLNNTAMTRQQGTRNAAVILQRYLAAGGRLVPNAGR